MPSWLGPRWLGHARPVLRIVTWNLWWRFGDWEARLPAILRTLAALDADIMCLQEVWAEEDGPDQAQVLAGHLGYESVSTTHRWSDGLSIDNAVLSRLPIGSSESRALPGPDGEPGPRQVLLADLTGAGGRIPVFTAHLDYRYDASALRTAQAAAVARFVAERRSSSPQAFPPVLAGDLNAVPGSDEVRSLTGVAPVPVPGLAFQDAWEQGGDGGGGHTWSAANPYLADAAWPGRRLDYVLVGWPRPRPVGNIVSCRIAGTEAVDGVQPSDHYAVVADLRT
jgi:endonuclease/exonuclease/phosphatase family metal-dependent hydrolase